MDEKIKTWTLRFPAKENPNMENALFDWSIVLKYDVKARYRFISIKFFGHEVFSPESWLNQPKGTRVYIRSINQSNRFISVRLLFLFCSRVFISRSYENHPNSVLKQLLSAFGYTQNAPVKLWNRFHQEPQTTPIFLVIFGGTALESEKVGPLFSSFSHP